MSKLTKKVIAYILAGGTALGGLGIFLDAKEGNRNTSYKDGRGIWTICRGITRVDGKPVTKGMYLDDKACKVLNDKEGQSALDWVDRNVKYPLTTIQKIGIASFCPYNIGPGKCLPSTFYKKLNAGDLKGACAQIPRWIYDGGKDCRIKANNCAGQPIRRSEELELCQFGTK